MEFPKLSVKGCTDRIKISSRTSSEPVRIAPCSENMLNGCTGDTDQTRQPRKTGCHNLISGACAGRSAARRAAGAPQGVGARALFARTPGLRQTQDRDETTLAHCAGDKRPVVKQKECCRRRFEAPAPVPAP
ncbi:hypothetical protein ACJJTC_011260 [Scirpophaga incertulas]